MAQNHDDQRLLYLDCLQKQLDEIDMLSSIYCNPGEIHISDPAVISDFNEYIQGILTELHSKLDYLIYIQTESNEKIEIHIDLPLLYPTLENAAVAIRSALLQKNQESYVKSEIENYISSMDKNECYIYQVITWLQDNIDEFLKSDTDDKVESSANILNGGMVEFERLWIYSHHLKSKTKRQEIVRNAHDLNLTGFSRPGKPGIICVEGLKENTQEFWKTIKSMQWHKITIRKSEIKQKSLNEIDKCRRFLNFKEEMFTDLGDNEQVQMDMSVFMKFLDLHNSSYIKKDLFGFE